MKIAFLGGKRKSGTTSNLYAVAGMLSVLCPGSSVAVYPESRLYDSSPAGEADGRIKEADISLTDLGTGVSRAYKIAVNTADILVINSSRTAEIMPHINFYVKQTKAQVFLLLGAFFGEREAEIRYLENFYRFAPERIGVIPYNSEFAYAGEAGSIRSFVRRKCKDPGNIRNEQFLQELRSFSVRLLRCMED